MVFLTFLKSPTKLKKVLLRGGGMDLTPDLIKDFAPEEQRFIETLFCKWSASDYRR